MPIGAELAGSALSAGELADLLGRWSALDGPLYRLLADRIANLADAGELPAGVRLPPERQLASAISVSRNTTSAAYQLLRDEGLAQTRQGAGTTISPRRTTPAAMHRANGFFAGLLQAAEVTADLGITAVPAAPQIVAALNDPRAIMDRALRRVLTEGSGYHLYGLAPLRAAIADRLTVDHQLPTTPEQVFVTTGAQQAIDLLLRTHVAAGQHVVVEDPTFPGALDALHRVGGRPVGLRVDDGLDPDELGATVRARRPALVYLILTHQNPTGRVVPNTRRHTITEVAAANQQTLFVDDVTLAELDLSDTAPPVPLAALAPRLSNVVTIGSLSKTYWGGLRIGWIRAGADVIGKLAAAKAAADLGGPGLPQAIAAALLAGQHAEILAWRRRVLRARRDLLEQALRAGLPSWSWTRPRGGLSLWVRLPGGVDSGWFSQAALRAGVVVVPGRLLSATEPRADRLRVAFCQPEQTLRSGAALLVRAWQEFSR